MCCASTPGCFSRRSTPALTPATSSWIACMSCSAPDGCVDHGKSPCTRSDATPFEASSTASALNSARLPPELESQWKNSTPAFAGCWTGRTRYATTVRLPDVYVMSCTAAAPSTCTPRSEATPGGGEGLGEGCAVACAAGCDTQAVTSNPARAKMRRTSNDSRLVRSRSQEFVMSFEAV